MNRHELGGEASTTRRPGKIVSINISNPEDADYDQFGQTIALDSCASRRARWLTGFGRGLWPATFRQTE